MHRRSRRADRGAPWLGVLLALAGILTAAVMVTRAWLTVEVSRGGSSAPPATRAPLDPAALATEGLSRLRQGDMARGMAVLAFAEQRSRRDWRVEDALMDRAIAAGHWDEAMAHADALLRTDREGVLRPAVFSLLNAIAAETAARAALVRRLGESPPSWWRGAYLQQLAAAVAKSLSPSPAESAAGEAVDPEAAAAVFLGVATSAARPQPSEYRPIIATLVNGRRYAQAIALWRALARRADGAGPLRDGAFDRGGDDTPFTWRHAAGVGAASEVVWSDGGPDLHVAYDGVGEPTLPAQLVVLGAGTYRLAWRERLNGPPRLGWRVRCADSGRTLADEAALPLVSAVWSDRALTFEAPPKACAAQWIELIAVPGERREDVEAWYASLSLTEGRGDTASPPGLPS